MKEDNIFKTLFNGITNRLDEFRKEYEEISEEAGLSPLGMAGAQKLYNSFFKRYERPDYSLIAGRYCKERLGNVERKELFIPNGDVRLQGYLYSTRHPRGMVVLAHGLHAGADDYIPLAVKFAENGYDVLSYDGTGTYGSEGDSTVGLGQALVDLNAVLNYVKSQKLSKKLFLVGHSCGGFAVTSVLALHKGISACAAIAPPNNCFTLILDKGKQYGGDFAASGAATDFLSVYQKKLFGSFVECDGVRGINSSNIPVLIAHGLNDKVISLGSQSIIAHKHEITNKRVTYYLGTGLSDGHDSIWHSFRAAQYKKEVDDKLAELRTEEQKAYLQTVDHALYSEVNEELFEQILNLFRHA